MWFGVVFLVFLCAAEHATSVVARAVCARGVRRRAHDRMAMVAVYRGGGALQKRAVAAAKAAAAARTQPATGSAAASADVEDPSFGRFVRYIDGVVLERYGRN